MPILVGAFGEEDGDVSGGEDYDARQVDGEVLDYSEPVEQGTPDSTDAKRPKTPTSSSDHADAQPLDSEGLCSGVPSLTFVCPDV